MLKICTVYHKGFYTPDYVGNLYRDLKKHSKIPFESICISDTDVDADVVLPYNHHSDIVKHWHKLKFFSPQFGNQKPGDDIIIMDIDQKIVNNVDRILNYRVKDGELLTYSSWWDNKLGINGGFYKFKSGTLNHIWDDFALNPKYWQNHYYDTGVVHHKYYGEQNYVKGKANDIICLPGKWLFKKSDNFQENLELQKLYCSLFKTDYAEMGGQVNDSISIIHYAGPGRIIK